MSYLSYNSVPMQVESFQRFDQVAIYSDDGADYHYTEFTIVVRAFWHPKGIASSALATAATSMDALRASLLTPRKQLVVSAPVAGDAGSTPFLRSPLNAPGGSPYATDCKLGPQPLFCNIQQIIGEEAMIVDFGIVTWVNECPGAAGNPISPILSHRWSQAHYIDEMQHTKRVVAGTAVLRSDLLYNAAGQLLVRPDDFRDYIFHTIPPNFRRVSVNVEASSDGTRLQYAIEDQEVDGVLDRTIHDITEVAHIEGTYSEATDAAPGVSVGDLLQNVQAGAIAGSFMAGAGAAIGAPAMAGGGAAAMATVAAGSLPTKMFEVNVRVQGTRRSTRTGLIIVAIRAAAGFRIGSLGQPAAPNPAAFAIRALAELFLVSNSIQVGLVEKWVQLRLTFRTGGISNAVTQLIGRLVPGVSQQGPVSPGALTSLLPFIGPAAGAFLNLSPAQQTQAFQAPADTPNVALPIGIINNPTFPDELAGVTKSNGTYLDSYGPRGGTLAYGFEKGSRGTTIAHLWTAALNMPCVAPAPPAIATGIWNSPTYSVNKARRTAL